MLLPGVQFCIKPHETTQLKGFQKGQRKSDECALDLC